MSRAAPGAPKGASRWIETWRDEEPVAALAQLVPRYLAAYGPATRRELLRWWGVARVEDMQPVVTALGDALTEVEVDGTRAYVRTEDVDAIRATKPATGAVQLVGTFDPLTVGAGLREQLIPPAHLKRVSRTAGWISPGVLVDGRVAGVWDSRRAGGRLAITVDAFEAFDRGRRKAVEAAAEKVASALGTAADVGFGRVFEASAKGSRLVIEPRDA